MVKDAPETTTFVFDDDGRFPNNALPLIAYHRVVAREAATPEAFEALLAENGWPPRWRYGVFAYHHYHATSHEALGVASGTATIMFGGPSGESVALKAGDAVLIPAGVAHMLVEGSADFLVVGAYPPGMDVEILTGADGERPAADDRIAAVPRPQSDPFTGRKGGLNAAWT